MKTLGSWLILLIIAVTITLFVISKPDSGLIWQTPWLSASQLLSLLGTVLMTITFVLSTRFKWLESLFGGLDKVMKVHHICGGISFLMLINHPLFMAVEAMPNFGVAAKYIWFSNTYSYNFGVGALYTLIVTLIATFLIKLPYNFWLKTHDFMGVVLILASVHIYTISSDISRFIPLRIWIFGFLATGLFSFIYKVFLYSELGPKYKYKIKTIIRKGDITEVILAPIKDSLRYLPGQFVFVSFDKLGMREIHPFTISSAPTNDEIRLSVKALGDYTLSLKRLEAEVTAKIWGPYGRFYKALDRDEELVMIAGGIGVTPFLSMLNYAANKLLTKKINIFYGANSINEATYDNELTDLSGKLVNLSYYRHFGGSSHRISVEVLKNKLGELKDKVFMICGPPLMTESIVGQLESDGIKPKNIYREDFNFK